MRTVELDGATVSAIGLGTWQFGSREWGYGRDYDEHEAPAIVRRALELGITFIDTAEAYGPGASERIIGRALADGRRSGASANDGSATEGAVADPAVTTRPFVATKWMPIVPVGAAARWSARGSQRRLGVETHDLYQLHWPNPFAPVGLQARALGSVVEAGLARRIGVSNHALWRWRAVERASGLTVVSDQVALSLVRPDPLRELVPWARDHGRVVIAYSPLGQGFLAHTAPIAPHRDLRRFNRLFSRSGFERTIALRRAVADIAADHGATPAQVALAWVIAPGNVIAIPGARTVAQLEENAGAADLELDPADVARLTDLSFEAAAQR